MDNGRSNLVPQTGMTIVGSDGETVGEIDVVEPNYVIVRKGAVFPQDHYIAVSDIVGQDEDGRLLLAIPADEALERGLGNPTAALGADDQANSTPAPVGEDEDVVSATDAGALSDTGSGASTNPAEDDLVDEPDETTAPPLAEDAPGSPDVVEPVQMDNGAGIDAPELAAADDDAHRTVTLSQEELSASTRPVERGVVRVQKQVIEEQVTIEVPLVEDEVHVTRRRVDREISGDDAAFEEKHIEVPLRGQGVEIEKRAHVVEEIEIGKTAHQEIREVTETVRHETARVDGDGIELPSHDEGAEERTSSSDSRDD